jgi:hypothetical protein
MANGKNLRGKYHCTVDLLIDRFGLVSLQIKTKIGCSHTADSTLVKQEVNGTVILPPLVFPALTLEFTDRFPDHYFYNAVPEEFAGGPHPGAIVIKLFCPCLTGFHTKLVFVRLDSKSFPMRNTLIYY